MVTWRFWNSYDNSNEIGDREPVNAPLEYCDCGDFERNFMILDQCQEAESLRGVNPSL